MARIFLGFSRFYWGWKFVRILFQSLGINTRHTPAPNWVLYSECMVKVQNSDNLWKIFLRICHDVKSPNQIAGGLQVDMYFFATSEWTVPWSLNAATHNIKNLTLKQDSSHRLTSIVKYLSSFSGPSTPSRRSWRFGFTWSQSIVELQTKVKRRFMNISQSHRRPLLGPSPLDESTY